MKFAQANSALNLEIILNWPMAASAVCSKFPQTQSHLFDCLLHAPSRHPPPTTQTILYIKRSAAYLHFHCAGLGECKMDIGHTAYKECFCGTGLITKDAVCVCMRWERSRASIPVLPLRPRDVTSIIILCPSDAKNESRANI
jgi:hypothetical protein